MFGRLGWAEILVIVVLVVILFGHNKIPGMMRNLADGLNIFKKELKKTAPKTQEKSVKKTPVKKKVAKKK
ncbi:MAG: twin-arginine translocase TatA/TatE family subunit [Alphaproteobacteria bacterium]|nr:twin-arginine translocase TatA/TatE family subunit [Alphaproteobacteria bacterium]